MTWIARVRSSRLLHAASSTASLQFLGKAQSGLILLATARLLPITSFGAFAAVISSTLLASSLWDFGTTTLLTRDVAAGQVTDRQGLRLALNLRAVTLPAYLGIAYAVVVQGGWLASLSLFSTTMLVLAAAIAGVGTLFNAVLIGSGRFGDVVRGNAIGRSLGCGLVLLVLFRPPHGLADRLGALGLATVAGEAATVTAISWLYLRKRSQAHSVASRRLSGGLPVTGFARQAAPYAAISLFNYAYNKADLLMVALLAGPAAAGAYAPGSQLQNVMALIPNLLAGAILPLASTGSRSLAGLANVRDLTKRVTLLTLGGALPLCLILISAMPILLPPLLGHSGATAVTPAQILVGSLPFLAISVPLSQAFVAVGAARETTFAYGMGFLVAGVGNLVLDPIFGANGGAVASFLRDPVVLGVMLIQARKVLFLEAASSPLDAG